jgi:hypothetical protein
VGPRTNTRRTLARYWHRDIRSPRFFRIQKFPFWHCCETPQIPFSSFSYGKRGGQEIGVSMGRTSFWSRSLRRGCKDLVVESQGCHFSSPKATAGVPRPLMPRFSAPLPAARSAPAVSRWPPRRRICSALRSFPRGPHARVPRSENAPPGQSAEPPQS